MCSLYMNIWIIELSVTEYELIEMHSIEFINGSVGKWSYELWTEQSWCKNLLL